MKKLSELIIDKFDNNNLIERFEERLNTILDLPFSSYYLALLFEWLVCNRKTMLYKRSNLRVNYSIRTIMNDKRYDMCRRTLILKVYECAGKMMYNLIENGEFYE